MRALVLHGPGAYSVESEWPTPEVRPGWARVRVTHAGICGSDLPRFSRTGAYHHPIILGHEFSGVVDTPAPASSRFKGGERVAVLPIIPCGRCPDCEEHGPFHCQRYQFLGSRNDGGFAEYCLVPESNLLVLPPGVSGRVGALVEPLAVALHVLRRSGFRAGDRARVYGAGPIGILVAFWLQVFGAEDIVLADIREESTLLARSLGLPAVNVSSIGRDWAESAHVVVEAAGAAPALCDAILTARRKGKVVVVGRSPSDTTIPHDLFEKLMRKELLLVGCWGYDLRGEESFLLKVLSERGDFLEGLITHEVTLADAPSVLRRMIENDFHYCKLLITLA